MNKFPKISVVTVSFNQAQYLSEALDSVLNQNYKGEIEHIIVDPGSSDGSREIVKAKEAILPSNIKYVKIFEPDSGAANGLNKGFARASGDILCYLNSDDFFEPNAFFIVKKKFKDFQDVDVICAHGYAVNERSQKLHRLFSCDLNLSAYAHGCCILIQQSTFFTPKAFKSVGGFNEENDISWDGELVVDFKINGFKFKRIHSFLSCFRFHDESISSSQKRSSIAKLNFRRIVNKIESHLGVEKDSDQFKDRKGSFGCLSYKIKDPILLLFRVYDGFVRKSRLDNTYNWKSAK